MLTPISGLVPTAQFQGSRTRRVLAVFTLCAACMFAQGVDATLDGIAKRVIAQERVVGASVLVARGGRIVLQKGYGFADLGLEAPTKAETVYQVVGPMMLKPFKSIVTWSAVIVNPLVLASGTVKFPVKR